MELEFIQLELKYEGLRIMDRQRVARMVASLIEHGQRNPVLVIEASQDRYVLIDGYLRVAGLKRLARDTVQALVLPMSEVEALVFHHHQQKGTKRSVLEEGWLIRELKEMHGMSLGELSLKLDRSMSWVSRRLGLVKDLPVGVQELVRDGKLCAYSAMKYLVPLARAKKSDCIQFAEGIKGAKLSSRQVGDLYVAWRQADKEQRNRIVEHPLLYLKAAQELTRAAPIDTQEEKTLEIIKDVEMLRSICERVCRRVREVDLQQQPATLIERLKRSWTEIKFSFASFTEEMEDKLDDRLRHTQCDFDTSQQGPRNTQDRPSPGGFTQHGQADP